MELPINTILFTTLTLTLFMAFLVGSFVAFSYCVARLIGFFDGARLQGYTQGDAISERKHKIMLAVAEVLALGLGAIALILSEPWLGLVLACSIGSVLGVFCAFWMNRGRLLPAGWPRQSR